MEEFYAKIYGEPLDSAERLPREIAIVSLSRIDAEPITERLLSVFKAKDREPVVQYLAWEALHARHASLSPEQRSRWVAGGLKAAAAGAFPGATATPLLLALASMSQPRSVTSRRSSPCAWCRKTTSANRPAKAAIDALRQLVAAWHEPRLVRALIKQLNKSPALAPRASITCSAVSPTPAGGARPAQGVERRRRGLRKIVARHRRRVEALRCQVRRVPSAGADHGPGRPPVCAELEIAKLAVSDFDLVWCIDSTGSMNEENQLVARETGLVLRVFALVSRRARCGTIYFRHETDAKLMQSCCERAKANPPWYQVKGHPLTPRGAELTAPMTAKRIPRPDPQTEGNVHPGCAFHAAMSAAMDQMPWSKDAAARKAIVLVGDSASRPDPKRPAPAASPTPKRRGFQVHAFVRGRRPGLASRCSSRRRGGVAVPHGRRRDPRRDDDCPTTAVPRRRRMMIEARLEELDPHAVFGRVAAT